MRYIVESVVDMILKSITDVSKESLIRVDGFENIEIYNNIAINVLKKLKEKDLKVTVKLSSNKFEEFKNNCRDTSCLQAMKQHDFVADKPLTYYRNLHNSNALILMATEAEEDKGGLANIFTITPDTIVKKVNKDYSDLLGNDTISGDKEVVKKLYGDLFNLVPVDICKLSDQVDSWDNKIETIDDFIELFFADLPKWGLPYKKAKLPNKNVYLKKNNILKIEYDFISRQMFKRVTKSQFGKYKKQLEEYPKLDKEYTENWEGWQNQAIKSYKDFSDIVRGFINGEKIKEYRELLLYTDFNVIEDVFDIKIGPGNNDKVVNKVSVVTGEPLEAFTKALLWTLNAARDIEQKVTGIKFQITQADIVSMYSDVDDAEEEQQLLDTWNVICAHTNGIIEYLNKRTWRVNGEEVELCCEPEKVFSPLNSKKYINDGIVKAASPNKVISVVTFRTICKDENGNDIENLIQEYQWKFYNTSSWLHNFSDICRAKIISDGRKKYIPVAIMKKLKSLLFVKSEEEFFDLYDENDISFDYDLTEYIDSKCNGDADYCSALFDRLGEKFVKLINSISTEGFYTCIGKTTPETVSLITEYQNLGEYLLNNTLPENKKWLLDAFIHAFNIENNEDVVTGNKDAECCIVPAWHPAALEKLCDQRIFFLDGCQEWWDLQENNKSHISGKLIFDMMDNLIQMGMLQNALDLFPSYGQVYFGSMNSFGAFSVYGRNDIKNNGRLKDIIHKDAIYDDDFDSKSNTRMNDNAKMIYDVIKSYTKAFPNAYGNLSIVFVNPSDLQPIVAAMYGFIEDIKKNNQDKIINICLKILVKPENKGGRNYLAYWMDECFSQDSNVNIRTYLNEWSTKTDLEKLLNGNNDIAFVMDLLKVNNYNFIRESKDNSLATSQCRFPIVFKPSPVSDTSSKTKRKIELSQPQFRAAYTHTQVVRYRNNSETIPDSKFIAIREVAIDEESQEIVYSLHEKAYWVVCIDGGMDGALLRNDDEHKNDYSIIGFSTGKGAYGQYNLTITARKSILDTIRKKLEVKLYQLFHWDRDKIRKATDLCLTEASGLDGISLLSAINKKDNNIHEFMAYTLTSLIEKNSQSALKIVVHLDSYKHWFGNESENDESKSRPDFLVLEANMSETDALQLKATVVECKIALNSHATEHKEKALEQVKHGIDTLSKVFDPKSKSINRRYWYAQLYRALAFAQVTFSDNSSQFAELSSKLRSILDGNFEIEWNGKVLGFWIDLNGEKETIRDTDSNNIKIWEIPQQRIQELLLSNSAAEYVEVDSAFDIFGEGENRLVSYREGEEKLNYEAVFSRENRNKIDDEDESVNINNDEQKIINKDVGNSNDNVLENKDTNLKEKDIVSTNTENTSEVLKTAEDSDSKNKDIDDLENIRVVLGKNKLGEKVYWEFGNPKLANRHMLITGTSGQGKTYSIQTMLYELSKSNISAVIFDYTEGFRKDQLEEEFISKIGNKISQHIVKVQGVPVNPFKKHEIDVAGMKIEEPAADVAARFSNILGHVYGFGDQQLSAVFEATRIGLEKYGDNMNMDHFREELDELRNINKSATTVTSRMTPFFHSVTFNQDSNFDWGDILYSEEAVLKIFQLTMIDREMQVIITELMLWDAWYYTKKVGNKDKPFVVVLDEAQNLSHKKNSPSAAILTEGRKFGWSAWFATQSLKILAEDEVVRLLQAACKLYFKPTDDEVIKMSKQLDPTDGSAWLSALKSLNKGQCIVVGERVKPNGTFGQTKPTITSIIPFKERS